MAQESTSSSSSVPAMPSAAIAIGGVIVRVTFLCKENKQVKKMWSEDLFQAAGYTVAPVFIDSDFLALHCGTQTKGVTRLISLDDAIGLMYALCPSDRAKWEAFLEQHQLEILTKLDKLVPDQFETKDQEPTGKQIYQGLVSAGMVAPGQQFEKMGGATDEMDSDQDTEDEYFEIPIRQTQIKGRTTANGPRSNFIAKLQVSNGGATLRVDDGSNLPFWLEVQFTPEVMAQLTRRAKPQL